MTADEHASSMEWPVCDSSVVHLKSCVQQMWAPTRRNNWQGTVCVLLLGSFGLHTLESAGAVLFFCLAALDCIPDS